MPAPGSRSVTQAFTFDRHFVTMGFEKLPPQDN
jgi:hypothetical protein